MTRKLAAKLAIIGLAAGTLLAACAPDPAPAPALVPAAPPPAPPPPSPPEPAPSTTPFVIRTLSCADLLGASNDDRAAASMFIIGYRAGMTRTRSLSISQIQAIEEAALQNCAANMNMTAIAAFARAFATTPR
jgi:hypothetical protein